MPCYNPLDGFICQDGKWRMYPKSGDRGRPQRVPCGQCVGCRLERSRQWAIRCSHEASMWERNCFLTLTYNDENLPKDGSLNYKHFQDFMKRLRFSFKGHRPVDDGTFPIRFYMCGEYGEKLGRPHYHACIFNFDFEDKVPLFKTESRSMIYRSKELEKLWTFGFSSIGDVNFKSAAYVARYIMKKVVGQDAEQHYSGKTPEFTKMSLKPGIAARWFEKYKDDVYKFNEDGTVAQDAVFVNGRLVKPPRYYDKLLSRYDFQEYEVPVYLSNGLQIGEEWLTVSESFDEIKATRESVANLHLDDNTPERLRVKEQLAIAKLSLLKRKLT